MNRSQMNTYETIQKRLPIYSNDFYPSFLLRQPIYTASEVREAVESDTTLIFVNTSHPFFICLPPKTGCTQMKSLVSYVNGGHNYFKSIGRRPMKVHTKNPSISDFEMQALSPSVLVGLLQTSPRVLITRNPYIRFLSGYLDWCVRNRSKFKEVADFCLVSFGDFVTMVETDNFLNFVVLKDHHSHSISKISNYARVRYSTILRLEEQDLWYTTFVKNLGLQSAISGLKAEGFDFYQLNTSLNSTISDKKRQVHRLSAWKGQLNKDKHENYSEEKLFEYYTPDLARRVFNLQREDFEHFAYPAWDGDPATFRIL